MLSHRNKYILYLVILNGFLTALYVGSGRNIFEDARAITGIGIALAVFFLYEVGVMWFIETKGKTMTARQSVNIFLGFKAGKIFLSLIFIAIYAFTVKVELKRFAFVFLVLYLIYLIFDTMYLLNREKDNKKKYKMNEIENVSNYYKNTEHNESFIA